MRQLKMAMCLILLVSIFASCEKETIVLPQNIEANTQKNEIQNFESITNAFASGIDLESYSIVLAKQRINGAKHLTSQRIEDTGLQFFSNPEEFPCSNLPTEDFEEANISFGNVTGFFDVLDENTENDYFSAGDILPGVNFTTSTQPNIALQGAGFSGNPSISILANTFVDYFIINFTTNDVTNVNMKIISAFGEGEIIVEIFGSSGTLGTTSVYGTNQGTYWGVQSEEPITKITLYSPSNQAEGIDDLSFGSCSTDFDRDGFLNENDSHPYSDLSETINIGYNSTIIKNKMVKNGSTMMDQLNDLIDEINSQYNGENYAYLHKKFMTGLAHITYYWRLDRLITAKERSLISSIAWGTNIPYTDN